MADFEVNFSLDDQKPIEADFTLEEPSVIDADFRIVVGTPDHNLLSNRDLPDQHPISAITGLEDALNTFVFEQGVASAVWVIEHNLNKYPTITLVDSAGVEFQARKVYDSINQVTIYLNGATTGKAYLN